jgi:hypothetical protein
MGIEFYTSEIERAFNVLSIDEAEMQNYRDIEAWCKDGYINHVEMTLLKEYNKTIYRNLLKEHKTTTA